MKRRLVCVLTHLTITGRAAAHEYYHGFSLVNGSSTVEHDLFDGLREPAHHAVLPHVDLALVAAAQTRQRVQRVT